MKQIKYGLILFLALLLVGCGSLDPAGVYKGDKALYSQDVGIRGAYDLLHTFVTWEYQNRAALADKPEVTNYADTVRANSKKWITSAIALRDAYAADPTPGKQSDMERALSILQEAMTQAAQYMAQ